MSVWDSVMSGISTGAGAAGSLTSRIFDLVNSGQNPNVASVAKVRDINTNGFLAQESLFSPNYFVRAFDEPTYLTFRIEFCFDNPRNAMYNNNILNEGATIKSLFHGETTFDYLPEAFLQDGVLAQADTQMTSTDIKYNPWKRGSKMVPENNTVSCFYSTEDYLAYSLGEFGRARLMRKIKMELKDLQDNFPYYFRSIEGLNSLNKIDPKTGKRVDKGEIVIKCYEGLDLKITQLLQMIRKVMWDDVYQRWVLPDMMKFFSMKIYVSEIRTFHEVHSAFLNGALFSTSPKMNTYDFNTSPEARNATVFPPTESLFSKIMRITGGILTAAEALGSTFFDNTWLDNAITKTNDVFNAYGNIMSSLANSYQLMCVSAINNIMPTICFELHMCEFNIEETFNEMNSLKSTSDEPQEQTIRIKVGQIEDYQVYPLDRNLKMTQDKNGYIIDTRIYGYDDAQYADGNPHASDTEMYRLREDGFTGTTAFADKVFDKDFNKELRASYEKARTDGMGVYQDKVYRHLSNMYDGALKSYFADLAVTINSDDYNSPISPRANMYSRNGGINALYSGNGPLRYKRNTLPLYTNIMSLIYSGLNATGMFVNNPFQSFSKATSITHETLETELPEVYAAAQALRETFKTMHDNNFDEETLIMTNSLYSMAFSKATQNSAIGTVAKCIYATALDKSIYEDNAGNFTTIGQDPDHNRPGNSIP